MVSPAETAALRLTPLPAPALGPQAELCCELWDDGRTFTGALTAPEGLLDPAALAETAELFTTGLTDLIEGPTVPTRSLRRAPEDHI